MGDALVEHLRNDLRGEVLGSDLHRSLYGSDASNYKVSPLVVVHPRDGDDLQALVAACAEHGTSLTMRGAGTSAAGNAMGPGIVADTSVHMNRILDVDPVGRTARVQPGVILGDLQRVARLQGLRLGPDPSTQSRATIGGMIGNNACGAHSLAHGKMADNVIALDCVDGTGRRFTAAGDVSVVPGLRELVSANLAVIRAEFGRFGRQVSGYSLEHLLPERGQNVAKALVGTEGTLAVVSEATVRLVDEVENCAVAVLGYPTMVAAADDVPRLLGRDGVIAMEGMDARLVDVVRRARGDSAVPPLPGGRGWLMVEVAGESLQEASAAAEVVAQESAAHAHRVLPAGPDATRLWQLRSDGAGLGSRTPSGKQAWPGWEDAAVPPEALGPYLRGFEALMERDGLEGLVYGHFGDGCIHVRLDIPLEHDGTALRRFVEDAAELVITHGGSLSGEHGDGRARSELLDRMYSREAISLMSQFKGLLDPLNRLNPGVVVNPRPLDLDLRRPAARPVLASGGFAFGEDDGDFTHAVHRCVGVGKCRADNSAAGEFMCPSYRATRDETHVTRGRARVLQDLAAGAFGPAGWRADEVHEALDLCLSCKACASDCPVSVDMATYKSEALFRRYQGRVRPASHYALGRLPTWARLAGHAPRVVNALLSMPTLRRLAFRAGGIDARRTAPRFASRPFRAHRAAGELSLARPGESGSREALVWVDSFTAAFRPEVVRAAVTVLADAGYEAVLPPDDICCGLTWISTGQLTRARSKLSALVETLVPFARRGLPIVGLEPSCTAVLRSDLLDLLPGDEDARQVAGATRTLAQALAEGAIRTGRTWVAPDLSDVSAVVQPHCHHHAVMGFEPDIELLTAAGAQIRRLSGCCGLAGNFGMEAGHYETSVAVAELELLPALRDAPPGTLLLADGFSCRVQAEQLAGARAITLAELLAERIVRRDCGQRGFREA